MSDIKSRDINLFINFLNEYGNKLHQEGKMESDPYKTGMNIALGYSNIIRSSSDTLEDYNKINIFEFLTDDECEEILGKKNKNLFEKTPVYKLFSKIKDTKLYKGTIGKFEKKPVMISLKRYHDIESDKDLYKTTVYSEGKDGKLKVSKSFKLSDDLSRKIMEFEISSELENFEKIDDTKSIEELTAVIEEYKEEVNKKVEQELYTDMLIIGRGNQYITTNIKLVTDYSSLKSILKDTLNSITTNHEKLTRSHGFNYLKNLIDKNQGGRIVEEDAPFVISGYINTETGNYSYEGSVVTTHGKVYDGWISDEIVEKMMKTLESDKKEEKKREVINTHIKNMQVFFQENLWNMRKLQKLKNR